MGLGDAIWGPGACGSGVLVGDGVIGWSNVTCFGDFCVVRLTGLLGLDVGRSALDMRYSSNIAWADAGWSSASLRISLASSSMSLSSSGWILSWVLVETQLRNGARRFLSIPWALPGESAPRWMVSPNTSSTWGMFEDLRISVASLSDVCVVQSSPCRRYLQPCSSSSNSAGSSFKMLSGVRRSRSRCVMYPLTLSLSIADTGVRVGGEDVLAVCFSEPVGL